MKSLLRLVEGVKVGNLLAARTKRGGIRREPRYNPTQFVWSTQSTEWIQAGPLVVQVRLSIEVCCRHAEHISVTTKNNNIAEYELDMNTTDFV